MEKLKPEELHKQVRGHEQMRHFLPKQTSNVCWITPAVLAFRRLKQEDYHEFQPNQDFIVGGWFEIQRIVRLLAQLVRG